MCIFCKIINGEIPCFKLYEDEDVLAFLDISQATRGHTLIVPKKHFENVFELDKKTSESIMNSVVIISNLLKEKLGVSCVNLLNNSGALAGQTVMHFHMHIIPRYESDNVTFKFQEHDPNFNELQKLYDLLIK